MTGVGAHQPGCVRPDQHRTSAAKTPPFLIHLFFHFASPTTIPPRVISHNPLLLLLSSTHRHLSPSSTSAWLSASSPVICPSHQQRRTGQTKSRSIATTIHHRHSDSPMAAPPPPPRQNRPSPLLVAGSCLSRVGTNLC